MNLWISLGLAALAGTMAWSFAEYALHNWNGHHLKGRTDFSREHLAHHAKRHYFAPAWKKARAVVITIAIMGPLSVWCVGALAGSIFTLCFVASYLFYEWLHRHAHTHPPRSRYGRWVRKHHFAHHFTNAKYNHGVSSLVWDRVFGTHRVAALVRVPQNMAMPWLVNPETGDVYSAYASDYQLIKTRRQEVTK